ncbi:MAG: phosphate acyltransferase PlsX [Eubacterium sp.]
MSRTIVALDCMGGDNAPGEIVKGAVEATNENKNIFVKLVGAESAINEELSKYDYDRNLLEIVNATEVIETGEPPVAAIRGKKDSSLVKCMYMVKRGEADAMVSAGSTGANLVGGHIIIGRIKGVERPPLAPLIPTKDGAALLIDCGANVDARSSHLLQFARMGSVYMENIVGIKNPRVAIVNIGAEEEKGNALVKETYPLLRELKDINFVGNIEARDIPEGAADVIVCDAFVGNVILKLYEGVGSVMLHKLTGSLMSSFKNKIGALLIKKDLKKTMKSFMIEEYGGAPLLGLNGLLVKTHGNSKSIEIKNSIFQCATFKEMDLNNKFKEKLALNNQED